MSSEAAKKIFNAVLSCDASEVQKSVDVAMRERLAAIIQSEREAIGARYSAAAPIKEDAGVAQDEKPASDKLDELIAAIQSAAITGKPEGFVFKNGQRGSIDPEIADEISVQFGDSLADTRQLVAGAEVSPAKFMSVVDGLLG